MPAWRSRCHQCCAVAGGEGAEALLPVEGTCGGGEECWGAARGAEHLLGEEEVAGEGVDAHGHAAVGGDDLSSSHPQPPPQTAPPHIEAPCSRLSRQRMSVVWAHGVSMWGGVRGGETSPARTPRRGPC
jgi:hypothetical protein